MSGMDFAGVQRSSKRLRFVVELPSITVRKIVYKAEKSLFGDSCRGDSIAQHHVFGEIHDKQARNAMFQYCHKAFSPRLAEAARPAAKAT